MKTKNFIACNLVGTPVVLDQELGLIAPFLSEATAKKSAKMLNSLKEGEKLPLTWKHFTPFILDQP